MTTVGIVQARTTSSRLARKVLLDLAGAPLIIRMLERVERARALDAVWVATSTDQTDDELARVVDRRGTSVFRGSLEDVLSRGLAALVLTNAMKPMVKCKGPLLRLKDCYGDRLTIRVSIDHYGPRVHEWERGERSWQPTTDGLVWLARNGFSLHVASRRLSGEPEAVIRNGFAGLFADLGVAIDAEDPIALTVFPEMDPAAEVPEITEACWDILHKSPADVMCSSSRMVVKRNGEAAPVVLACTLLPYDRQFELGHTLKEASGPVPLNHPHCAKFCVLGGAACSR